MNTFGISETTISFINNDERDVNRWTRHKFKHYGIMHRLFNLLRQNGFEITNSTEVAKIIRKYHYVGSKDDLKFKAERYPNGFKLEFYQEINVVNSHGGYYDFDKFQKMPYLIKKKFQHTVNIITEFLSQFAENKTAPIRKTAEDKIKYSYVTSCHKPQLDMNFNLSDLNGTTCEIDYNSKDRNGNTIYNGDFKYFRNYNGYLQAGIVYHDLNNMWFVMLNDSEIAKVANFNLFDLSDDEPRCRVKRHNPPESYVTKRKVLSQCSVKELKNELKRRQME